MTNGKDRIRDTLDIAPHFSESDAIRLNNLFRGTDTAEMLASVIENQLVGDIALVSSFGTESAVLLHLVASIDPEIAVFFLDTGKHFPETIAYRDELSAFLGLKNLQILTPNADDIAAKDGEGIRWQYDPDGCCALRKVAPLDNALKGFQASFTGRKGFQSATRSGLPRFEMDRSDALGRLKINPLASWSPEMIAAYFAKYNLPRHPLESQGYPSIGCAPCTSKVAEGEDPRSGRWKGFDKTECGLHAPVSAIKQDEK